MTVSATAKAQALVGQKVAAAMAKLAADGFAVTAPPKGPMQLDIRSNKQPEGHPPPHNCDCLSPPPARCASR